MDVDNRYQNLLGEKFKQKHLARESKNRHYEYDCYENHTCMLQICFCYNNPIIDLDDVTMTPCL
jgi:hypothetical protein